MAPRKAVTKNSSATQPSYSQRPKRATAKTASRKEAEHPNNVTSDSDNGSCSSSGNGSEVEEQPGSQQNLRSRGNHSAAVAIASIRETSVLGNVPLTATAAGGTAAPPQRRTRPALQRPAVKVPPSQPLAAAPSDDAARRQPASAASADEDDDQNDSESEEEEEGEEPDHPAILATQGRCRGKGNQPLIPPAAIESRKRLFEILERRVGSASVAADGSGSGGSGRRLQYSDLPAKNLSKKAKLLCNLKSQFDDWHSRLRSNFSVLLYGFGSKRAVLDDFARMLAGPQNRGDAAVLVFHGYNPRCTAKEVVTGVAGALMQRAFRNLGGGGAAANGSSTTSAVGVGGCAPSTLRALVENIWQEPPDRHAFVVIHNIDGPGLRSDFSLLSTLAACPQVHIIASIDHAMAPLLWDSAAAGRFRWQYINATTFMPYSVETSGAQSVLVGAFKSGVVTAGAGTVLRSLVLGAQEVFKVLAEHILEDEECEGVAFAHLYRMCRERFLVRDERILRQHLVEFVDHQLVRLRPASDNSGELLEIPMSRADMRAVLEDLQAAREE